MEPYYQDEWVTLYHGDCLELSDVWTGADVLVTDPPYGMSYKSGRRAQTPIAGDQTEELRDKVLVVWDESCQRAAIVFGTWKRPRPAGVRQLVVWDKRGGAGFSGDLAMPWADITEEIYVIGRGWVGGRVPAIYSVPTLPSMNRPDHPTPKPVPLMELLIEKCPPGVIADPFAGSGSTLLAARNLGRKAIGVEMEEKYCELIAKRLDATPLPLLVETTPAPVSSTGAFDLEGL